MEKNLQLDFEQIKKCFKTHFQKVYHFFLILTKFIYCKIGIIRQSEYYTISEKSYMINTFLIIKNVGGLNSKFKKQFEIIPKKKRHTCL